MKISLTLLATTVTAKGGMKEWEVQNAYFADEEIILPDSNARSNKQWHECGKTPQKPMDGQGVTCVGNTCFAVCPIGWRSQGRWKIKCKANNTWSHTKFSPCVTCPDMSDKLQDAGKRGVQSQSIVDARNYPVTQFFCGDNTEWLGIKNHWYKRGGDKKNVRCLCKKGQNGDPAWKKSCSWSFKDAPWSSSDVDDVQCKPADFKPPSPWTKISRNDLQFKNVIVYPNYEVSLDLKLDHNTNTKYYTNIFGFYQPQHADWGYPLRHGTRIPAVFILPGSNRLHVCSSIGTNANNCWNTEEYKVGEGFNLKIQECLKMS